MVYRSRDYPYQPDPRYRFTWFRLPETKRSHYMVYYKNQHVGDFFKGKSGRWFAVMFGRITMWSPQPQAPRNDRRRHRH